MYGRHPWEELDNNSSSKSTTADATNRALLLPAIGDPQTETKHAISPLQLTLETRLSTRSRHNGALAYLPLNLDRLGRGALDAVRGIEAQPLVFISS